MNTTASDGSSPKSGLIDVHHHFLSKAYLDAIGVERAAAAGSSGYVEPHTAEQSIAFMDQFGIQAALMSVSAPGIDLGSAERTARLARECNEAQAEIVLRYPRRFGYFAILPLPDIKASLDEIEYALDDLNADGVVLMTNYRGTYIGSPTYWPVFDELDRRNAVAFFHPVEPEGFRGFEGVSLSTMEFPFDTTRALMSLLHSGTLERFPNVRMVFSHAGGAMPYLAGRTAVLSQRNPHFKLSGEKLMPALRNVFYDVTQSLSVPTFSALSTLAPPENIMFGSDCPFAKAPQIRAALAELDQLGLDEDVRIGVERDNALRLFPRLA